VPTGFQYGTSDTDLLHTGNTGRTTYANAAFDIININELTPYQQQYSYAYSDTQVLVITNTTIQQLNDMWLPWGFYQGSGNQKISVYDQLSAVDSKLKATFTGTFHTIIEPIVNITYGQINVTQQMLQDLNQTWERIHQERLATEYNESTSFILNTIPNTLIPL